MPSSISAFMSPSESGNDDQGRVTADVGQPARRRIWVPRIFILLFILAIVGYAACFVLDISPLEWLTGPTAEQERAARQELESYGAITVMDANQRHVATANLTTIDGAEEFRKAFRLLSFFPRLQVLELTGTDVRDADMQVVGGLRRLTSLHLNGTGITDAGMPHLARLNRLESLHLAKTEISAASIGALNRLTRLKILDLSHTGTTDNLPKLSGLRELEWLVVFGHPLTAEQVREVARFPRVSRVNLDEAAIDTKTREQILSEFPGLSLE